MNASLSSMGLSGISPSSTGAWSARRWNSLVLGVMIVIMIHLSVATDGSRNVEPWPALLSGEPADVDPDFVALQQRAQGSLEKLEQAAQEAKRPF